MIYQIQILPCNNEKRTTFLLVHKKLYLCVSVAISLVQNNEELRNTNGCYLVTQFSSNPNNRLILR